MTLSVIIVSYNVRHYLAQCLWSVERAIQGMDADVWVVDNASTDDSVSYLQTHFPWVHLIANADNRGFACANNQAIRACASRYVLLLNPDTVVGEDVLRTCVRFLDEHLEAGATGVRMVNSNGEFARESRRGLPTPLTSFYKMCGLCALFPRSRRFGHYYLGFLKEDEANRIEVMSGAFCMLRREALDQVGLLDEDYFMYGEDIDLSYRLLQGGWQNWYLPVRILHYKGESTQKTSYRYVQIFYDAMLIFFNKHFARRYWLSAIVIRLGVRLRAACAYAGRALCRWRRRICRWLHADRLTSETHAVPESLFFFGSDEAWQALQVVARRANLVAQRADEGQPIEALPEANYLVFDPSAYPYRHILDIVADQPESRRRSYFGFFSVEHPELILPYDIFE